MNEKHDSACLRDYRPPEWLVPEVSLDFRLDPEETLVRARMRVVRNAQAQAAGAAGREPAEAEPAPLWLDGDIERLLSLRIDGRRLKEGRDFRLTEEGLLLLQPPGRHFLLETEVIIYPAANTNLSGLYLSDGVFCTQCEAEGFRRITFWPDRPDVMSRFTVRIEAERELAPVLLSNGNMVAAGACGAGRHYAVWRDPFPKPSYLFALVAGRLEALEDEFITMEGRRVRLRIWVQPGLKARARWAMESLKAAMRWDERRFGLAYDLDEYNIVAVPDFNMGAMENKGLNIFNDRYILADPAIATDSDYENVEAIVAHEYFHNWTGNRITLRDWFQLCLKEGLTVFRDQEFTSDMRSRAVKRIEDVRLLRSRQFPEDAGPLAHPVRPECFGTVDNLYTATVYEKGAEVVRMLHTLLGEEAFMAGMRLYVRRFDGRAATVEDFLACMAEAGGRDLSQFMRWYTQAGTPHVHVRARHDARAARLELEITQHIPDTPGQKNKLPHHIPLRIALLGRRDGRPLPLVAGAGTVLTNGDVLEITGRRQRVVFENVPEMPVISLNRGFSAPVRLQAEQDAQTLLFLLRHESDAFARWDAAQRLGRELILRAMTRGKADATLLAEALGPGLETLAETDPAFLAELLRLPSMDALAAHLERNVDPAALWEARREVAADLGRRLMTPLRELFARLKDDTPHAPTAAQNGRRAARAAILQLLVLADEEQGARTAMALFRAAGNMTETAMALDALTQTFSPLREEALSAFIARWRQEPLLVDKWLAWQAMWPGETVVDRVRELLSHPLFNLRNPNRVRALVGTFATANPLRFNAADGSGYALVGDVVIALDALNPQLAARLATTFRGYSALEPVRRAMARRVMELLAALDDLSPDVRDIIDRMLQE
jgi:aminopeptidase N